MNWSIGLLIWMALFLMGPVAFVMVLFHLKRHHPQKIRTRLSPSPAQWTLQQKDIEENLEQARQLIRYVHTILPTNSMELNGEFESVYHSLTTIASRTGEYYGWRKEDHEQL